MANSVKKSEVKKSEEQSVRSAIDNLNANGSPFAPKMPDLNVSKRGGKAEGEVMFLPNELDKVKHSLQTALVIYAYFHLCHERDLVPGKAWISKEDINNIVIVSDRPHPTEVNKTWYTWKNWQTGEVLVDKYVQDTVAQYTANTKRYAIMAKQR